MPQERRVSGVTAVSPGTALHVHDDICMNVCVMRAVVCQTAVRRGSDLTVRSAVSVRTALCATAETDAACV